jgi:hypothetical protein
MGVASRWEGVNSEKAELSCDPAAWRHAEVTKLEVIALEVIQSEVARGGDETGGD